MKKTTWAIIGLSFCVVALSIALVVVITQKKTEPIIAAEPWQPSRSFSIRSDYTKTKSYYYGYYDMLHSTTELDKKVDFLGERVSVIPYRVYMLKRPYQKRWYETKEEKK